MPSVREQMEAILEALEPVAEQGNVWAITWRFRLRFSLHWMKDEDNLKEELEEFRKSLGSIFRAVAAMYKVMIDWGLVPDTEENEHEQG